MRDTEKRLVALGFVACIAIIVALTFTFMDDTIAADMHERYTTAEEANEESIFVHWYDGSALKDKDTLADVNLSLGVICLGFLLFISIFASLLITHVETKKFPNKGKEEVVV